MLLVFRIFRNYLTKNPSLLHEFVDKTKKNDLLNYLKNVTFYHVILPSKPHTCTLRHFLNTKSLLNLETHRIKFTYKFLNISLIDTKIDETSVTHSMEKPITRRQRRSNVCRKITVKTIKKKKRFRKKKMQNFWLNYQAVQQPHITSWQTNQPSFTEDAKSYSDVVKTCNLLHSKGTNLKQFLAEVRHDIYTPYGQWLKDSWIDNRAKNGLVFKVLSYNVLAQHLLEMHRDLYKNHNTTFLNWEYRKAMLLSEFKKFDADILCLQEVETCELDFFNEELGNLGYQGIFKKRTHEKEDGCAIYYRIDKFELKEHIAVEYHQPNIFLLNRDNIGLLARLSPKQFSNTNIVVANTHLLFNPNRHDIKLAQMQMLLAEIDRIAYKCYDNRHGTIYYPVVLTGDFNMKPFTYVYNLLNDGYVGDIAKSFRNRKYSDNSNPNQLMPPYLGVTDGCQHYDVVLHRTDVRSEISDFKHVRLFNSDRRSLSAPSPGPWRRHREDYEYFGSGCLYHNLHLNSVYPQHNASDNVSTFQDRWCNVDYIFYGPCRMGGDQKIDGQLKLVSFLNLPNTSQAEYLRSIPNEECASDHLPLVATFHIPSDA